MFPNEIFQIMLERQYGVKTPKEKALLLLQLTILDLTHKGKGNGDTVKVIRKAVEFVEEIPDESDKQREESEV